MDQSIATTGPSLMIVIVCYDKRMIIAGVSDHSFSDRSWASSLSWCVAGATLFLRLVSGRLELSLVEISEFD